MLYYHGSCKQDLKILNPFVCKDSVLKKPCVYLTTNRALASLYIWDKPFKWMNYGIGQDGVPIYTESFPQALSVFYKGLSGCMYTCRGEYPQNGTGISSVFVSENPVPVESSEYIGDAWEELLRLEKAGALRIQRYETLSQKRLELEKRMILQEIQKENLLQHPELPLSQFIRERFPSLWQKAETVGESH